MHRGSGWLDNLAAENQYGCCLGCFVVSLELINKKGIENMKVNATYLVPLLALGLVGCSSTKISDLGAYQKVPLQQLERMPSKAALEGAKSRVIVYALEDSKSPGTGTLVSDTVTKELNTTNNVVIVDRALAASLSNEIQLAEAKGRTGYKGQDVADFAIMGKVTDAGAGVRFTEASSWTDKEGKTHYVSATCTKSGKVSFSLKIVQLPALDVVKTIDEEASTSSSEDTRYGYCPELSRGAVSGLISSASANAVQKVRTELKNQFAPAGYVVERRTKDKDSIFKTTLGSTGGAKEGLAVVFVRPVQEQNALTGVSTTEQQKIAEGVISDQIGASFSFVIISDKEKANQIKLGEKVQVKFEDSFMDSFNRIAH